ncbi:MAG: mechanosensitive ion channel family protein, partial [Pseudomonadota bacterium]
MPDPYPLRPADTTSPRATLQSFLANMNEVIQEWRQHGTLGAKGGRAFGRAIDTLDLSSTPRSDSWSVQIERLLFLKEILDRVELPDEDQIPGESEVKEGAITQWSVPNTRIRIARIEDGLREGEFLFTADTVQRLDRLYRHAEDLPYKSGASIGIYQDYVDSTLSALAREGNVRNRLKPVDTSDPRSTLVGFLESVNRAYALIMDAEAALTASPPTMTRDEALEVEADANLLIERAIATLDLAEVPRALRDDVGIETALQLKEVMDRIGLPPLESVPDLRSVQAASRNNDAPLRWRYPDTQIEIVEVMDGPRRGQYLFSAATVDRVGDFYRSVASLTSGPSNDALELEYRSPQNTEGFYEYYISTPGYLIPRAMFMGAWLDDLPPAFKALYAGQAIWQWIATALCLLVVLLVGLLAFRLSHRLAASRRQPLRAWVRTLPPVLIALLVTVVVDFVDNDLNISGGALAVITTGGSAVVLALTAWAIFMLCTAVAETAIASPRILEESIDATLWRISARVVGFFAGAWIVIDGAQELGADMVPLIAGLGVGGLAVALAAQHTLANFIGSVILLMNKPVRVGDFCRYGDRIGTVEQIGLISTRIRTLERTVVTVPNAEFSEMKLDNFNRRDQRLFKTLLQLRYETTPEQMRYLLVQLRELLVAHPMVTPDPARVRFVAYGPYSKDVEIFAYLRCQDQNTFLAIQEDLLLRIEDAVSAAGCGFAFPSQTAYLARDDGTDSARGERAESLVAKWRARGKLPFPDLEDERRDRLVDTLAYPPEGSPEFKRTGHPSGTSAAIVSTERAWALGMRQAMDDRRITAAQVSQRMDLHDRARVRGWRELDEPVPIEFRKVLTRALDVPPGKLFHSGELDPEHLHWAHGLESAMAEEGWSETELATEIDIEPERVIAWLKRAKGVAPATRHRIAMLLHREEDDLFKPYRDQPAKE